MDIGGARQPPSQDLSLPWLQEAKERSWEQGWMHGKMKTFCLLVVKPCKFYCASVLGRELSRHSKEKEKMYIHKIEVKYLYL